MSDRAIFAVLWGCVVVNAGTTALNVALYAAHGDVLALGAAVFCGCCFVVSLVNAVR